MALTLTPAVTTWALNAEADEKDSPLMRLLHRILRSSFSAGLFVCRRGRCCCHGPHRGLRRAVPAPRGEFMAKLEEVIFGFARRPDVDLAVGSSGSGEGCAASSSRTRPVVSVVSQLGRPDDGTDVGGINNVELFAPLKPFDEWPSGLTKEKLTEQVARDSRRRCRGVIFSFSQYISDNVEEALSGVRAKIASRSTVPTSPRTKATADGIADTMAT